jgi:hypothetical protein
MNPYTTLTGLTLEQVTAKLDAELPPDAYSQVPGAVDLTDIDPAYMRQTLNAVFGLCGLGWGYNYDSADLSLEAGVKPTRSGERPTYYATLRKLEFWYVLVAGDSAEPRRAVVPSSGASENPNPGYALSGAVTNALGKAVSNLGFQESVYLGRRSHATVQRTAVAAAKAATAPTGTKPANGAATRNGKTPATVATPKANGAVPAEPGEYVIAIGTQYKDKPVKELPAHALLWFAEKMAATTPAAQAAKAACAAYLAQHPELRAEASGAAPVAKA